MPQPYYVGLDISVKETTISVVDELGHVAHRAVVATDPAALVEHLVRLGFTYSRIGLEAGPLSAWIYAGLVDAGLPAICVETRHMHAALSARINKTDRNDALGIAQMMRVGLFKVVHVKTPASQQRRLLLTARKLLQRKVNDIENDLRGQLRNFGLKVGTVRPSAFEQRVRELVADMPFVAAVVIPLLDARSALRAQLAKLHKMLLDIVRADPVCRRLMTAPGVGAIAALTFPDVCRQSCSVQPVEMHRRPLRAHTQAISVRRDGPHRTSIQVRRCDDASGSLRGRIRGTYEVTGPLEPSQGMGRGHRQAARNPKGGCRRRPQAGNHPPPHVARRDRLPLDSRESVTPLRARIDHRAPPRRRRSLWGRWEWVRPWKLERQAALSARLRWLRLLLLIPS